MRFAIETERLRIRPWRSEDRGAFERLSNDPEMMRYMTAGRPWNGDEVDAFFARQATTLAEHGHCLGAVEERATGRMIGLAGLQFLGSEYETGYWIARELWGQGYASEAAEGALRHAFDRLGAPRVIAITDRDNRASRRVMEKIGMTFERETTGAELGHRQPEIEVVLYAIERAVWEGRRTSSG
jgi:RimJ/RimL family protein N-acetyltransferase